MTDDQKLRFGKPTEDKLRKLGALSRRNIEKGLPALGKLVKRVKETAKARGMKLKGIDGRELHVRGLHSALNTVIQSSGAVLMKRALVILDQELQDMGLVPGEHYEFVANVHDEFQIEVDEGIAEKVGELAAKSITKAGEYYKFRCRLDGAYEVGNNWSETH